MRRGGTGRATEEALARRGPRLCLTAVYNHGKLIGLVIRREGSDGAILFPGKTDKTRGKYRLTFALLAKSFKLRYLLAVGHAYLQGVPKCK